MPFEPWMEPSRTRGRRMSAKTTLVFSATFGAAFLLFCLLCNLGLLLTVHGSVEAGYSKATSAHKVDEKGHEELVRQRLYFLGLWLYTFLNCFTGVPSLYLGLRGVVSHVTTVEDLEEESSWLLNLINKHSAIHAFLFLVMLLVTWAGSYAIGVDATSADIHFFAATSFISISTVYAATILLVTDIRGINRQIAELNESSNPNVQV